MFCRRPKPRRSPCVTSHRAVGPLIGDWEEVTFKINVSLFLIVSSQCFLTMFHSPDPPRRSLFTEMSWKTTTRSLTRISFRPSLTGKLRSTTERPRRPSCLTEAPSTRGSDDLFRTRPRPVCAVPLNPSSPDPPVTSPACVVVCCIVLCLLERRQ